MNTVEMTPRRSPAFAAAHHKQALTFMLIQRRGGFIQNQNRQWCDSARASRICCFSAGYSCRWGDAHQSVISELGQGLARLLAHCAPAKAQPRLRQTIQHNVFRNGQAGHQRHIDLLLHQMNAQLFRIRGERTLTG